jgi:hypothetical protein
MANIAMYKAKAKTWRDTRRAEACEWLLGYLCEHACVDCGENDPVVLQFDHVRGAKRADMAQLVQDHATVATLEAEAAKCDVRCANCHVKRTARQFGWWRARLDLGAVDELGESAALQAASSAGPNPVCAAAG